MVPMRLTMQYLAFGLHLVISFAQETAVVVEESVYGAIIYIGTPIEEVGILFAAVTAHQWESFIGILVIEYDLSCRLAFVVNFLVE